MSITWKEMVSSAITGSAVTYYTAPVATAATIQAATAYNPTGSPVTVNVYKVPTARAADATTLICSRIVPAGATVTLNETLNHKLEAGSQLFASGAGCTLTISGVQYVAE
jgi:hypothetical protein